MNAVAESLTGFTQPEAMGRPLDAVFRVVSERRRQVVKNPASRALREGVVVGLENHFATVRHGCPAIDRGLRG